MNFDRSKFLSSSEVKDIINTCGQSGVSVLKYGDLYVRFGTQTKRTEVDSAPLSTDKEISAIQQTVAEESLRYDERALKEDRLAQLLIEDPQEAERLIIDDKLDEDADGSISD